MTHTCLVSELVWVISVHNVITENTIHNEVPQQIQLTVLKDTVSNAVSYDNTETWTKAETYIAAFTVINWRWDSSFISTQISSRATSVRPVIWCSKSIWQTQNACVHLWPDVGGLGFISCAAWINEWNSHCIYYQQTLLMRFLVSWFL
jgi:hypothetical protein